MKRAVCVVIALLLVTNLFACGIQSPESMNDSPAKEELFEIVWPESLLNMLRYSPEEQAEQLREASDKNICTSVQVNSNNTITVTLTEEQRKNMKAIFLDGLTRFIESYNKNINLITEYEDDYSRVSFYIERKSNIGEVGVGMTAIIDDILLLQLYETKDADNLKVRVCLYNSANRKLLTEGEMPGDEINLTPEMWDDASNAA